MIAWRPSQIEDIAALALPLPRRQLAALIQQMRQWPTLTMTVRGQPVAFVTVAPYPPGFEFALTLSPQAATAHWRVPVLRALALAAGGMFPHDPAIMHISDHNAAGRRLARMAGFIPLFDLLPGTTVRKWLRKRLSRPSIAQRSKPDAARAPIASRLGNTEPEPCS